MRCDCRRRPRAELEPYDLEQVARSHRYERTVDAFGQACPVVVTRDAEAGTTTLSTAYGASTATWRAHARTTSRAGAVIDASFDALIANPVGAVNAIIDAHADWVAEHWSAAALDARGAARGWDPAARADAERDAWAASGEVDWIRAGVKALAANTDLREAFIAMNRAMKVVGASKGYTSWRLFQIAWIVGCLPAVADPTADPDVQIETVETGGGKSEAYLGVVLLHLFYWRLTGGTAGVNVWARFPLRLLSTQQTARFAQAVLAAEVLRQNDARISAGDPFGVGFFVGSTNTPNKIYPADSPYARGQNPADPAPRRAVPGAGALPMLRPARHRTPADRAVRRADVVDAARVHQHLVQAVWRPAGLGGGRRRVPAGAFCPRRHS